MVSLLEETSKGIERSGTTFTAFRCAVVKQGLKIPECQRRARLSSRIAMRANQFRQRLQLVTLRTQLQFLDPLADRHLISFEVRDFRCLEAASQSAQWFDDPLPPWRHLHFDGREVGGRKYYAVLHAAPGSKEHHVDIHPVSILQRERARLHRRMRIEIDGELPKACHNSHYVSV